MMRRGGRAATDSMRTLKITLAYDGAAYCGWQLQLGQPSLQAAFEKALAKITGESIRVTASGRTDAGVHALGQVVGFTTHCRLAPEVFARALNAELPRDMAVLDVCEAREGFHAIRDALRKRYRYVIHDGPTPDVFRRAYCWHYRSRLDDEAMHRAAQALAGRHDFRSFETQWPNRATSVRTIFEIGVRRGRGEERDLVRLDVAADGFLYNMVRAIVGTLVEVGRGVQAETWPAEVLAAGDRDRAGMTAPPDGLFLVSVDYETNVDEKDTGGGCE